MVVFNYMEEIWKLIDDFNDYQISNLGRVKSLKYGKERILKLNICGGNNEQYLCVKLSNKKIVKTVKVHKLVSHYFIDKNSNLIINHIDGNSFNNIYSNLEYVTVRENNTHKSKLRNNTPNVNFCKIRLMYRARINYNKKDLHLGYFKNKEDAYNKILLFKNEHNISSKYD